MYRGYHGRSLDFLKEKGIGVSDTVVIDAGTRYEGTVMPRYEHTDDGHISLKLKNGYNVGVRISDIRSAEKISEAEPPQKPDHGPDMTSPGDKSKPRILLISTGGTIASKIDYRTGAVTPVLTASELHTSVPELSKIANIETEQLLSEYSENLQPSDWKKIAQRLDKISGAGYSGVIVAHGTDTMHYTSAFLSFALAGFPIPITLVGSQRSSDRPSSDAASNLIAAARFITEAGQRGVYVVMHNTQSDGTVACHLGTRVRKNHTSRRAAFETIGGQPAFVVDDDIIHRNLKEPYFAGEQYRPALDVDSNVGLVKYHPGYNPELLDSMIESGCRAVIIEGTGLGHVGKTMYDSVKKAADAGVFLGMCSQCIDGRVRMTVYESGRDLVKLGIVPLGDMIAETALVKAMWVVANHPDDIRGKMLEKMASEYGGGMD